VGGRGGRYVHGCLEHRTLATATRNKHAYVAPESRARWTHASFRNHRFSRSQVIQRVPEVAQFLVRLWADRKRTKDVERTAKSPAGGVATLRSPDGLPGCERDKWTTDPRLRRSGRVGLVDLRCVVDNWASSSGFQDSDADLGNPKGP